MEAIDLLTDFVGRPKIDADELDKERGVVIQEIQRYKDQPAAVAEELIDRAHFGDHPARAAPSWAPRSTCGPSRARRSSPSASAAGPARTAARSSSATSTTCRPTAQVDELFGRFPDLPEPEPYVPAPPFEPRVLVEERDTNQSHLRMSYRPDVAVDDPQGARRLHHLRDAAGRLDGLAPVRRDPRAARPLLLGLRDRPRLRRRAGAAARLGPRVGQVRRGLHADARDRRRAGAPTARRERRSSARAPTRPGAASWPSRTPTRSPATRPTSAIVFDEDIDPDSAIAAARRGHLRRGRRGRAHGRPRQARRRLRGAAHGRRVLIRLSPSPGAPQSGQNGS